jgi:thimet oligopeptidase
VAVIAARSKEQNVTPAELTEKVHQAIADPVLGPGDTLEAYDELTNRIDTARRLASLMTVVHPSAQMRAAAEAAEAAADRVMTSLSLDTALYERLSAVDLSDADGATRHWVGKVLRDFRRAGVTLDQAGRERLGEIREELVKVGQAFSRNINSDTRVAALPPSALDGLPADYLKTHQPEADGLVRVSTDYADFFPFMSYSRDGAAREQVWKMFRQRGYPANVEVLRQLLELRKEMATLLGYESYARFITEDKMIGSDTAARAFIDEISAGSQDRMRRDVAALLTRKQADDPGATKVDQWDVPYLMERVRAEQFEFDSLAMRPYFEYGRVREGLMDLAGELFGIQFTARPEVETWHEDVEVFDVSSAGVPLGRIFLDNHPRPDKFSHAMMKGTVVGKAGQRRPECVLVCNLPRPGELLQPNEVTTFFHEFGHMLHHIFAGSQRWSGLAGVRTEWDFVEAPSQLLEEWINDWPTLARFARHHETGETLPESSVTKMRAAEEFGKGLQVRQQMAYADLSLSLYQADPAGLDPLAVERAAFGRHLPFDEVKDVYFHLAFGHLDGYSALYYTYMWSLVIAKDLFTAFDSSDLLNSAAASRYREKVLAAGASAPAAQLVRDFLGRDYTFDAFKAWLDS